MPGNKSQSARSRLAFALLFALLVHLNPQEAHGIEGEADSQTRRVVHLLGYVASDYGGAVRDGKIVDQGELDEQVGFLREAATLLSQRPNDKALEAVRRAQTIVDARGGAAELAAVLGRASKLLQATTSGFAPSAAPSAERGRALFEQHCASCHGSDGSAQTPAAAQLKPPPADLLDPRIAEWLSPSRVALAVEFGIPGTGMVAQPDLTEQQRWDVAFYASSLPYRSGEMQLRGPAFSLAELATLNNHELREEFLAIEAKVDDVEALLGYSRAELPFASKTETRLGAARTSLRKARVLLSHDREAARALVASALADLESALVELRARSAAEAAQFAAVVEQLRSAPADGLADPLNAALIVSLRLDTLPSTEPKTTPAWRWILPAVVGLVALVLVLLRRRSSHGTGV